jgi:choline dehydrogenase-like flavoprotein
VLIDLQEIVDPLMQPMKSMVCIAGAGIAGLVLAVALADAGIDVQLLEAGGRKDEDRSQSIYDADMLAGTHTGTTAGRFRVFGGTSTRWGGQILPFTEDVFFPPSSVSGFSWPVSSDTLKPFYNQIEKILGVNSIPFDIHALSRLGTSIPACLDKHPDLELRFSKWAPFSRRNLAQTLGVKAIESGKIRVYLHANLTECLLSADGSRIEGFLARNYQGTRFKFTAQQYVLATGTIETSRLLLASRSVCPAGVGNSYDQVGRGFHDHVSAPVATIKGAARKKVLSWMGPFFSKGTTHTGRLEATIALRRRLNLPAIMAHCTIDEPEESGMFMARELLRSIQRGNIHKVVRDSYRQLPAASLNILRLGYQARIKNRRAISSMADVTLRVDCEQSVRAGNRILIADQSTDALGIPKAIVDWRVSGDEILSLRRYSQFLREEFDRLNIGAIDWDHDALQENSENFPEIRDTNHPMGGTVMGFNPSHSVVNDDLRVHGVANLYIASCSTFPSGGSSNPTFTMIALALRLSERLAILTAAKESNTDLGLIPSDRRQFDALSAASAQSGLPSI